MKDIRERQGRSKRQTETNYKVMSITLASAFIILSIYTIINILT